MPVLKICRICLDINVRGYSFDLKNLREEYEDVTGVKLHQGDGFPHWVCFECAALLHKYHKFKEKCHKGQKILERLQNAQPISYKAISCINRFTEDLHSKISLVVTDSHTKTFIFKHQNSILRKELEKRKLVTVKEVIYYDSEGSIKQEDVKSKEVLINKQEKDNETAIKTEHVPAETVEQDISMDLDNEVSMDVGNASSDDENIFLDIVKKAVNGENQLVFLDGVKDEPINDSNKAKPRKFTQRKKEYLSMEYWKKYRLTEEEANATFSRKEHSDKYVKANYNMCGVSFVSEAGLAQHCRIKHFDKHTVIVHSSTFYTHVRMAHRSGHICSMCGVSFVSEAGLAQHCRIKHFAKHTVIVHSSTFYTHVRVAHRSGHICSMCGVSFVSEAGLAQHCRIKHFDKHTVIVHSSTFYTHVRVAHRSGHICRIKHFAKHTVIVHSSTFYTHVRMAHRSGHICSMCGVSFVSEAGLAQHCRIKHFAKHTVIEHSSTFYTHVRMAHRSGHICSMCGVSFVSEAGLAQHCRIKHFAKHTVIVHSSTFYTHVRVAHRSGHICSIMCGVSFVSEAGLAQHCRIKHFDKHTVIVHSSTFYTHVRMAHRSGHICSMCGVSFETSSETAEKNIYCEKCDLKFVSQSAFNLHLSHSDMHADGIE
ncbi:putative nuclear transcription factor, X-box binding protein [Operophtera brumata]|uniref:Putative nuclear transcription factor, X-box binding protein n=1 Tax=Operophtera brumata TaxID=104452 RepID=A0A0L7LEH0_OPEBR|nr:putative nuclear transcription factor, X-box binding protein [Operophtera brumata]